MTPTSTETWTHTRYAAGELSALIESVTSEKRTGQVTLHFGQGSIMSVEWKQKVKVPHPASAVKHTALEMS